MDHYENKACDAAAPSKYAGDTCVAENRNNDTGAIWAGPRRDVGWAVKQMWAGQKVTRRGWNGRGMFLELSNPQTHAHARGVEAYVVMRTAHGGLVPWTCSQSDLLATDWNMHEVF